MPYDVLIDPGHGGADSGAVNSKTNTLEKNLNMDSSLSVEYFLGQRGRTTKMTRTTDVDIDNYQRAYQGVREGAKIFVSVHHDSAEVGRSLVYHDNKAESIRLANKVAGYMGGISVVSMNQSPHGRLYIADFTTGPSILIEMGPTRPYTRDERIARCQPAANAIADFIANNFS
ncbi:N-acetylmuramoyl-L-alanine amidase [Deinococcus radiodurans]|jgi:N-acetylmuramoyl-L-alanine amidase|uniref:N-acetylmuramoyl-L-alanine amidase n=2 Tax=Deinococcus radiodurans TaxID=1299 RepID=UPI00054F8680|nr:N-acetylmuramoyl-L-alanine amidase [Deinococcus radiodurans]QIP30742.1 N-acetylmuramoyl-L-alanine amidase [Deinococcus radiodurans]QIP33647.1 N-acetylmuramoyl-L-alanine amidase [Deinococcus radiodurans]